MQILKDEPIVSGNTIYLIIEDKYIYLIDFYELKVNEIDLLNSGYDIRSSIPQDELEKIEPLLEIIKDLDFNQKKLDGINKDNYNVMKLYFVEKSSGFITV